MAEYGSMINRQRKWMLYLLAVLVLGAGFSPYPSIFLGLILGSVISFYNLWLMQKKIDEFAEAVEKKTRAKGLGTLARLAAVALGVIIVMRYGDYFNLIAFVIGLMTSYIVIMIDFIFSNKN
ncbi:ATP synthase subunit I [Ornithinibacillus sp. 4-3]|uniref:ATP synthase subunit I n=1 Tax=Ornithinibacillus sp. 4-3 TaxID=3231488 RepID=A0AB39HL22_9BACI